MSSKLLDHPLLSRLGNLETLLKWATVAVLGLVAAAVALFELFIHAGAVADVLFALALMIAVAILVQRVAARRSAARTAQEGMLRVLVPKGRIPGVRSPAERKEAGLDLAPDPLPPDSPDAERERGLRQMDAIIRQQWHEAQGERRARETIPPEHRQELRNFLAGAIKALEADEQYRYDEVPAMTQANRAVFAAHFPKAAERLDEWNRVVFDRDKPIGDLRNRITREAQARGFNEPGDYWQNEVAQLAQEVTLTRLRKSEPDAQLPSLIEWDERIDGFGPTLHANDHRIVTAQPDSGNVLQRRREAVERWLAEVQSWPEVHAISTAERQYGLYGDRHDLLAELRKLKKIEHLPNAKECEICRGNWGDFS